MAKQITKCKHYRKARGKNACQNFLEYKEIELENYDKKYLITESCVNRCRLGKEYINDSNRKLRRESI